MTTKKIIEDGIKYTVRFHNDGTVMWAWNNRFHRVNGPAIIYSNRQEWWFHGRLHRIEEWWNQHQRIDVTTQEEFLQWLKLKAFL